MSALRLGVLLFLFLVQGSQGAISGTPSGDIYYLQDYYGPTWDAFPASVYTEMTQIASSFVTKTAESTPGVSTAPDFLNEKQGLDDDVLGPPKTDSSDKNLKIKMCNNDNFNGKIERKVRQQGCIIVDAHEGKCKKYLFHSPVTAFSMASEWKCMLYSREHCSTVKGRMTLLTEATANIGPHMNDRMQSFRCVQRFNSDDVARAAAYMCTQDHWQGPCAWQRPALGRCLNLPGNLKDKVQSFTPDAGFACTVYEHPRCNVEKAGYSLPLRAPGAAYLGKLDNKITSMRCIRDGSGGAENGNANNGTSASGFYAGGGRAELARLMRHGVATDGAPPKVMTPENWDVDFEYESFKAED